MRRIALMATIAFLFAPTTALAAKHHHKPKPKTTVALGITGTGAQYTTLRHQGLPLSIRATWESWSEGRSPEEILNEDREMKATPLVNWEPDDTANPSSPSYSLQAILEGRLDYYIRSWAETIKAYKKPVYLRFAHEMNGFWYPWSRSGPATYVAAWQHIWNIFHAIGAKNALFVWSPDGLIGQQPLHWQEGVVAWYPGTQYVNDIAMSTVAFASNVTYGEPYFFERLDFLHRHFNKPMILPEMKVTAAARYPWLRQLKTLLHHRSWIKALVWSETPSSAQKGGGFNTGNMDWSLIQDPEARKLLKAAVG
jgi:mannan endo-1,4-beta-mannosidase